jgi:hypothetical protein
MSFHSVSHSKKQHVEHDASSSSSSSAPAASAASNGTQSKKKDALVALSASDILEKKAKHLLSVILSKQPGAQLPPCLWPLASMTWIESRRKIDSKGVPLNKNYFRNIKLTSVHSKVNPGHIDWITYTSQLTSKLEYGIYCVQTNLVKGDAGFGAFFMQVEGPPQVLVNTLGQMGTLFHDNPKMTEYIKNVAYPDQHFHNWSVAANEYTMTDPKQRYVNPEVAAFERWLIWLQMSFLHELIMNDDLKKTLKPKTKLKDRKWFETTLTNFKGAYRLMKFDAHLRELKGGGKPNTQLVVNELERKIELGSRDFDIDGMMQLDETPTDASVQMSDDVVAMHANEVHLTEDELKEYLRLKKINENCLDVFCNKMYLSFVNGLAGYKKENDEFLASLNMGENYQVKTQPLRLFPHPQAPLAPKWMWPILAETIEPYIAEGHISARAPVFKHRKGNITEEMWQKTAKAAYDKSEITQQTPFLDQLYKERNIVLNDIPTYAGFEPETPMPPGRVQHQRGDVIVGIYEVHPVLNAPVQVNETDKVIFSNLKLKMLSKRLLLRSPNDEHRKSLFGGGYQRIGQFTQLSSLVSSLADSESPRTSATLALEEEEAALTAAADPDALEFMRLLATNDDQISLPLLVDSNDRVETKEPNLFLLTEAQAVERIESFKENEQKLLMKESSKGGKHLEANLKQLPAGGGGGGAAAARGSKGASGASASSNAAARARIMSEPTAAPDFGEDDTVDAGAEYVD